MTRNVIKKLIAGAAAAFLCFMPVMNVHAEDSIPVGTVSGVAAESSAGGKTSSGQAAESGYGAMQKSEEINLVDEVMTNEVTTEDLFGRISRKMYEIADGVRAVCVPITVITFVISVLAAIFGALSKKNTVMPGLIGAGISIIAFTLIYNAPSIILWGSKFLTS